MTTDPPPPATQLVRRTDARQVAPGVARLREGARDDSLDPRRIATLLWRRRWQVVLVAGLVIVPAMLATLLAEPLFRGTTLIEVSPDSIQVLPYQDVFLPIPGANYQLHMRTQEEILRGPTLLLRVMARLQRDEDPQIAAEAANLLERQSILQVPNSQLLQISYLAADPAVAASVANAIADEYIKYRFENGQETRVKARDLLEGELEELERQVQRSERELIDYVQSNQMVGSVPGQDDLSQEKLAQLTTQLVEADADLIGARVRVGLIQDASVDEFPEHLVTSVIEDQGSTLLQLERELTALRLRFGENWPLVVEKREGAALVRDQLSREKASALAQARQQAQLDQGAAENKRRLLMAAKTEQEALIVDLQNASVEYNILRREAETQQNLYEGLLERLRETGIAAGMELGNLQVVERALPQARVASPDILWNLQLASVLGFALGICLVLARDFWSDTVSTVEELEQVTMLPVLAPVPRVKESRPRGGLAAGLTSSADRAILSTGKPSATGDGGAWASVGGNPAGAEAIRTLCASILLSRSDHPPRVIAVTSAASNEGKTTIAVELGRALAQTGAPTLLVACDMRSPEFDAVFDIDEQGGLSLFLSGHIERPTEHPTADSSLFVVGAGPAAPNPVALLNSDRLGTFLTEAASNYAFVIADTPPVIPTADARVVAARADGVLLVVRASQTSKNLCRRALSVLEASGSTILGTVLNGADADDIEFAGYPYDNRHSPGS